MQNHKQRQRENRKAKRQLKHQLKLFTENNCGTIPVSVFKSLDKDFFSFAINETKRELKNEIIDIDRKIILEKVILLKQKLNPSERRCYK